MSFTAQLRQPLFFGQTGVGDPEPPIHRFLTPNLGHRSGTPHDNLSLIKHTQNYAFFGQQNSPKQTKYLPGTSVPEHRGRPLVAKRYQQPRWDSERLSTHIGIPFLDPGSHFQNFVVDGGGTTGRRRRSPTSTRPLGG
jgi:hypothetical protein